MKLSQFNFKLPAAQVALYPHKTKRVVKTASGERTFEITRRDESRLMVLHKKSETIEMYKKDENGKDMVDADGNPVFLQFKDIVNYFEEGDTFIFNDTKVFPARLYGTKEKTDAKIEVFLLRELNAEMRLWDVLVEPARKIRIGNKLFFDDVNEMVAEVIDNTTSRGRTLRFLYDEDGNHDVFKRSLFALGEAPLPRYIIDAREDHHATEDDMDDFQCVFAEKEGTAAAVLYRFYCTCMRHASLRIQQQFRGGNGFPVTLCISVPGSCTFAEFSYIHSVHSHHALRGTCGV